MELKQVVAILDRFAPTSMAESWDNVGLLLEPYTKRLIGKILLTNDLTEDVMAEVEDKNADMILSYHPPLFKPFKKITSSSWKESIVARCLEKRIAIFSPHTSYDVLEGGVNDWLALAFEPLCTSVSPLKQIYGSPKWSTKVDILMEFPKQAQVLQDKLYLQGDILHTKINGDSIVILCKEATLPVIVQEAASIKYISLNISKLEQIPLVGCGLGRLCKLSSALSIRDAVSRVKTHLSLQHVRLAIANGKNEDSSITSIAICAGAGSSVLQGIKADLWLTGELLHHDILNATHQGTTVILTDHSNSERGYLHTLQPILMNLFGDKVEIIVSTVDCDPLKLV